MIPTLLGGLSPQQFLAEYWQKKPLLVRQAIPNFSGIAGLQSREEALDLACGEDAQARLVSREQEEWKLAHGPFTPRNFQRRGKRAWTVLLQGVNLLLPAGDRLLRAFDFIPQARLDDLMVSYAVDGGGVGPHFDHYDVFLLQGMGQRRWRIGAQRDLTLRADLPLKILKDFRPSRDWLLNPGDLLYLPPQWAHDGTAVGACMTFSIGFRAPPAQELAEQFLMHLQDRIALPGRYHDADLRLQKHSAEIGAAMIDQVSEMLARIRWNRATVRDFLGCALTEPKPHVCFTPPRPPLSLPRFAARCFKRGVRLDLKTQLLFSATHFFINGEACGVPGVSGVPRGDLSTIRQLADQRRLADGVKLSEALLDLLYAWYRDGFLMPE
ncbi:MAG: cupin domain-containing protein [Betaproteobacteria bacterium]|nr:cupin domain-containing protein [Betaproteobacteria bacterium]